MGSPYLFIRSHKFTLSLIAHKGKYKAKKIGKNNPKEDEIKADNAARQEWNRTADMALLDRKSVV